MTIRSEREETIIVGLTSWLDAGRLGLLATVGPVDGLRRRTSFDDFLLSATLFLLLTAFQLLQLELETVSGKKANS